MRDLDAVLEAPPSCTVRSPGGHLTCSNPECNGRSHVWRHESAAPDAKRDEHGLRGRSRT